MRHGRAPFLPLAKLLLDLEDIGSLQVADLGGDLLHRCRQNRERRHVLGVPVALHDLRRHGRNTQAELAQHVLLDAAVEVRVVADRARYLAVGNGVDGAAKVPFAAAHLVVPHERLQAKRRRFGVDTMRAADHDRLLVRERLFLERLAQLRDPRQDELARFL